jgi:hypothetical protein
MARWALLVHDQLRDSTAARWRAELGGTHWTTKVSYYRAVEALLTGGVDARDLTWSDIVAAVRPHGSRTTFFGVAGPHAKKPLSAAYRDGLAACLERAGVPEMLVDETKVWSYWPYREGWAEELFRAGEATAVECLVRVVLDWAVHERPVAAALDHAPPICAVEDLVVLRGGATAAAEAATILRAGIRLRLEDGYGTDGVLHRLRPDLRPVRGPAAGNAPLARAIDQLMRNSHTHGEQRRQAVAMMRDAIAVLDAGPE